MCSFVEVVYGRMTTDCYGVVVLVVVIDVF